MSLGGLAPAPRRFGGDASNPYAALLQTLLDGGGSALSQDVDAYTYAESVAESRCLAALFNAIRRLRYQWDPQRMTDFLPRWETILSIQPPAGATDIARRSVVATRFARFGIAPAAGPFTDLVRSLVASIFVGITYATSATARMSAPGGGTITHSPSNVTIHDGHFSSGLAYVAVHVEQPASMSDKDFYATAAALRPELDHVLPAWCDWGWYRNNSVGAKAFRCDDAHNLDNEALS